MVSTPPISVSAASLHLAADLLDPPPTEERLKRALYAQVAQVAAASRKERGLAKDPTKLPIAQRKAAVLRALLRHYRTARELRAVGIDPQGPNYDAELNRVLAS